MYYVFRHAFIPTSHLVQFSSDIYHHFASPRCLFAPQYKFKPDRPQTNSSSSFLCVFVNKMSSPRPPLFFLIETTPDWRVQNCTSFIDFALFLMVWPTQAQVSDECGTVFRQRRNCVCCCLFSHKLPLPSFMPIRITETSLPVSP